MGVAGPRSPTSAPLSAQVGTWDLQMLTRTAGDSSGPAGRAGPTAAAGAGQGWGVGGQGKTEIWKGKWVSEAGEGGEWERTEKLVLMEVRGPSLWKGRGGGGLRDAAFYGRVDPWGGNPREGGEGAGE